LVVNGASSASLVLVSELAESEPPKMLSSPYEKVSSPDTGPAFTPSPPETAHVVPPTVVQAPRMPFVLADVVVT
jgi:hypothetical protein